MKEYLGLDFLTNFWREKYIEEYIQKGGSKIKFVTGRLGSGKTTFLNAMCETALENDFCVINFSAKDVYMNDFREIYIQIIKNCCFEECLHGCAEKIIRNMGYNPDEIPSGYTFCDYLASRGENDALQKREIRNQLKYFFLNNPQLDNNFALACSMMTGAILGHPMLEDQSKETLVQWLTGDNTVKLATLRALGLSPTKITKYNARHMLRSLAEVIHCSGKNGVLVAVDDMEVLSSASSTELIHYTKMKREDTYESIRQLIDDIDSMHNIMFIFAFDRSLIDDERNGLKSYQALWMRIQNEIISSRFNRFSDIVDMDKLAAQIYTPELVVKISSDIIGEDSTVPKPLSTSQAEELIRKSRTGAFGIPLLIKNATLGGVENV